MIDWTPAWEARKARTASDVDFRTWRAVVRVARSMSPAEARKILELPVNPSEDEIRRAWKVMTLKNHPDRGGTTEAMAEVNVAAETLLRQGVAAPSTPAGGSSPWEDLRRRTEEAEARNREQWQRDRERDQRKRQEPVPDPPGGNYSTVLGRGSGIEWKVISSPAYSSQWEVTEDGPDGRNSYQVERHPYLAFGVKGDRNYVLRILHTVHSRSSGATAARAEAWLAEIDPLVGVPSKTIPKYHKAWVEKSAPGWRVRPKWHVLDGSLPTEGQLDKFSHGRGLSLVDALVGAGFGAVVPNRKIAVQISVKSKPREVRREMPNLNHREVWRLFNFEVLVNGKGRTLNDQEAQQLQDKLFFFAIFDGDFWKFADKRPVSLTQLRKYNPAEMLQILHDALVGGPLKAGVAAAIEALPKKKASYDRRADLPGVVQPPNYCGPAALKAVLAHYGTDVEMLEIGRLAGTDSNGTPGESLVKAAQELGFEAWIEDNSTLDRIAELLEQNIAPIVDWWQKTDGHYSVVTSLNDTEIQIMDPSDGEQKWLPRIEFQRNWFDFTDITRSDMENCRLIIVVQPSGGVL